MNYKSIHDDIISRAKTRQAVDNVVYESHHVTPKCEGGLETSEQVLLTRKEHALVHKLRFKMNGVWGNYMAYNLMCYGRKMLTSIHKEISSLGGKALHKQWKERDPEGYIERQRKAAVVGGNVCKEKQLGFFRLSEEEKNNSRRRGRETTVKNKLGMFSDAYREEHKKTLYKKVSTPDGVFESMTDAAKYYGVCRGTMTYRVNSNNFNNWYLVEEGEI